MKILFITSSRIGDAVLSTGLLNYIEQNYKDAKVTVACGPLVVSLFEGAPFIDEVIALKKEKHHKHWLKLWLKVVRKKWDMVIDLRDSAVSRAIMAGKRYIFSKQIDKSQHKVLQNASLLGLQDQPPAPKLWFSAVQKQKAVELMRPGKDGALIVGIGPTANWIGKTWPVDRFVEIMVYLTNVGGAFEHARVAVFGAPGEEEGAYALYEKVPAERRIDMIAKGSPGDAAAALSLCDFYIGNDSGLMHCAAAAGVPTFGLFGPSYPHIYAPYGLHCDYAQTPESFDDLIAFEGYDPKTLDHSLMLSLNVESVKDSLDVFTAPLIRK